MQRPRSGRACLRRPGDHALVFWHGWWLANGDEKPPNALRGPCLAPPSRAAGGGHALLSTLLEGNVASPQRRQEDGREHRAQHTHEGRM